MAQLTVAAGVTKQEPVQVANWTGLRDPGWLGGAVEESLFERLATDVALPDQPESLLVVPQPSTATAGLWQVNGTADLFATDLRIIEAGAGGQNNTAFFNGGNVPLDGLSVEFTTYINPPNGADGGAVVFQPAGSATTNRGGGGSSLGIPNGASAFFLDTYSDLIGWRVVGGGGNTHTLGESFPTTTTRWRLQFTRTAPGIYTVVVRKNNAVIATWTNVVAPDSAVFGFSGGTGLYTTEIRFQNLLVKPRYPLQEIDPYAGFATQLGPASRMVGEGVALTRSADNLTLSKNVAGSVNWLTPTEATAETPPGPLWEFVVGTGVVTQSTDYETEGTYSTRVETITHAGGVAKALLKRVLPVRPGHIYTVGWDITVPTLFGSGNTYTMVRWLNAAGTTVGESTIYWNPASAPAFSRAAGQVTAPKGAVGARLGIWSQPAGGGSGYVFNLDKGLFREGASDGSYLAPTGPQDIDLFAGQTSTRLTPVRTPYLPTTFGRTAAGITKRHPVVTTLVEPPPTIVPLGHKNDRIQRQQRFGAQAVFFKDQGNSGTRITTARFGAQSWVEVGRNDSTWTRTGLAGVDLANQEDYGLSDSTWSRTAVSGVDVAVEETYGQSESDRTNTATAGVDVLLTTDVQGFAGRNGTNQAENIMEDASEWWFRNERPYAWPGGWIDPEEMMSLWAPIPGESSEWGWYIVPTAAEVFMDTPAARAKYLDGAVNNTGYYLPGVGDFLASYLWVGYNDWNSDGTTPDPSEGLYCGYRIQHDTQTSQARVYDPTEPFYLPAGDLYMYAYGYPDYDIGKFFYDPENPEGVADDDWDPTPTELPPPLPPLVQRVGAGGGIVPPPATFGAETRFPPANDRLREYVLLQGASGSTVFSDVAATLEPTEAPLSLGGLEYRGSVWFRWEPNYDGQVTLAAEDTVLEAYTGPAPTALTVGVDGYRGDWDAETVYAVGDKVTYEGVVYVTSAESTGKEPTAPNIVGADIKFVGLLSGAVVHDKSLSERVTLQPGTYHYIGDGGGGSNISGGSLTATGPATVGDSAYNTDASASWANINSYRFPFALYDSVTATEVLRLGPLTTGNAFGQGYRQRQTFTLTAAVTFDTLRLVGSGYSPAADDIYGIATATPGPNSITWAKGVSDLNPWTVADDTNPLIHANLMPMGAGIDTLTTETRLGDRFYIRAYPTAEAAENKTLTWETHVAYLDVTLPVSHLPSAPGTLTATVGNADPFAVIEWRLGADPDVVATSVADVAGFSTAYVQVPTLSEGTYLLLAQQQGSSRVGNTPFSVGDDAYAPPDEDEPPAPPVLPPEPDVVNRWQFQDPTDQSVWAFPINPTKVGSVQIPRQLTPARTTAVAGQSIMFEGGRRAKTLVLTGHLFTLAEINTLKAMRKPYRIYLTDDLGRTYIVKVLGVQTTPVRDTQRPEHHTYVVTTLLYGKVPT